ncbi:hypothetical protein BC938DRAFT_475366 [Jimgerdemannia flammicorona]|uniref:Protein kinase domain-containing protein n=1 Tax=Jimgerdemannia flammicorona TaxID=994334 RepID=A0A433PW17_9FUNG|nr:hypothetical protein BC938DRAFT_475366 [Jimgerdemannia flammicorona]
MTGRFTQCDEVRRKPRSESFRYQRQTHPPRPKLSNVTRLLSLHWPPLIRCASIGETDPSKIIKVQAKDGKTGEEFLLNYTNYKVIGNGSFGVVYQAKLMQTGDDAAIKRVLQDKRFKVRTRAIFTMLIV